MLSKTLRQERELRGWSQARLAQELGTDAATISRWERAISLPSPYFREKLCLLFEKSAVELGFLQKDDTPVSDASTSEKIRDTPHASYVEHSPTPQELAMAYLSYLFGWISGVLIWFTHPSSRFVRTHAIKSIRWFGSLSVLLSILLLSQWLMRNYLTSQRVHLIQQAHHNIRLYRRLTALSGPTHLLELRFLFCLQSAQWVILVLMILLWGLAIWQVTREQTGLFPWSYSQKVYEMGK